ncbi:hypothetical protein PV08_01017 [Exophiala spinifera]|uniref:Ubiquitin-conjugating enzyme E2C-binding protein n=1 Tax=Exophiala spinifera TaxID=91928 RepID=A0A0D2A6Q6_9EURO|nr:uncharacterized protein PV08_01017 [Exophiala spinifera]KIW20442.1 hypothetical protein PV08_01017 [Exophiala spinifera]
MPKPKIDLYAEALTNIRQLTLHASLQSEKNEHTKIFISSDKKIITAVHDGESSSIYLPTQISGTANVTLPTDKRTEFSARLQIDDVSQLRDKQDEPGSSEVPWSATELTPDAAIQCKRCSADIVQSGKINTWKDLPSDHWADLMDLWFCHKPHQGLSAHDHAAESKGFSAKSQVVTNIGVGLVDTVSFLLHREDCLNLQVRIIIRAASGESPVGRIWRQERSFSESRLGASVDPVSDTIAAY